MTSGGLVKTSTQVSPEQLRELEALAGEQQVSVAAVVRAAVRDYLTARRQEREREPVAA